VRSVGGEEVDIECGWVGLGHDDGAVGVVLPVQGEGDVELGQ
jgi:hypothetical protein